MTYMTHKEFYKKATENGVEWVKHNVETIILKRIRRKLEATRKGTNDKTSPKR